jgi:hypothetical protein
MCIKRKIEYFMLVIFNGLSLSFPLESTAVGNVDAYDIN